MDIILWMFGIKLWKAALKLSKNMIVRLPRGYFEGHIRNE